MAFDYNKLRNDVKELFDTSSDPEVLKKYASVSAQIDEAEKESSQLATKNGEVMKLYKDAILSTPTQDNISNNDGELDLDNIFDNALKSSK